MSDLALDTNAVIAFQRGDIGVVSRVHAATSALVPAPVIGELYFGAFNSGRVAYNLAQVAKVIAATRFVSPTANACQLYGDIRMVLRRAGTPIPYNDIWIAAICLDLNVPLLTRDAHFDHVPGLQVVRW